jgi:hypothetical protein
LVTFPAAYLYQPEKKRGNLAASIQYPNWDCTEVRHVDRTKKGEVAAQ